MARTGANKKGLSCHERYPHSAAAAASATHRVAQLVTRQRGFWRYGYQREIRERLGGLERGISVGANCAANRRGRLQMAKNVLEKGGRS